MIGYKTCRSSRDVHNVVVLGVFIEIEEVLSIESAQGTGAQERVLESARNAPHKDHSSLLISLLHQRKLVASSIVKQSVDRVCRERETAMLRTHIRCHGSLDLLKSIVPHDVTDSVEQEYDSFLISTNRSCRTHVELGLMDGHVRPSAHHNVSCVLIDTHAQENIVSVSQ